jgi:hypothetical protein
MIFIYIGTYLVYISIGSLAKLQENLKLARPKAVLTTANGVVFYFALIKILLGMYFYYHLCYGMKIFM